MSKALPRCNMHVSHVSQSKCHVQTVTLQGRFLLQNIGKTTEAKGHGDKTHNGDTEATGHGNAHVAKIHEN
eukprot:1381393-Lingulodinium_polyedra.AAC.1